MDGARNSILDAVLVVSLSLLCLDVCSSNEFSHLDASHSANAPEEQPWNTAKFKEEADQTYNLVFHKYNNRIRPPDLYVEVDLSVTLTHIRHLDVEKQEFQVVLDLQLDWMDSRLRWLPYKVTEIHESTDKVWAPDLIYENSVSASQQLYPNVVRITHNGTVNWMRKEIVTVRCDTVPGSRIQVCPIRIGFITNSPSNSHHNRFFFSDSSNARRSGDEYFNNQWDVTSLEARFRDENATESSTVDIEVTLERKRGGNVPDGSEARFDQLTTEDTLGPNAEGSGPRGAGGCNGAAVCGGTNVCAHLALLVCVLCGVLTFQ